MQAVTPMIAPDVTLTEVPSGDSHRQYRLLAGDGGGAATLPAPLVGLMLLFDGTRDFVTLTEMALEMGLSPPSDDFVVLLAIQMAEASLVVLRGRSMRVLETHQYHCISCGGSCQGPEIGPLPPRESARIERQFDDFVGRGLMPSTPHPLRYEQGAAFLARPEGRCAFLDHDNLCIIHGQEGLDAKPLACRLFPLVAVEAHGEMRLGMANGCLQHHLTFDQGESFAPRVAFEPYVDWVRPMRRHYAEEDVDAETAVLTALLQRGVTLPDLAVLAASGQLSGTATETWPSSALKDVEELVLAWARKLTDTDDSAWPKSGVMPGSSRAMMLRRVADTVITTPRPTALAERLPPRWRAYVGYRLRNQLWMRSGYRQGSLPEAALLYLLGVFASAWCALGQFPDDETQAYQRFGESLVMWGLFTNQGEAATWVLDDAARVRVRRTWKMRKGRKRRR